MRVVHEHVKGRKSSVKISYSLFLEKAIPKKKLGEQPQIHGHADLKKRRLKKSKGSGNLALLRFLLRNLA